MGVALYWPETGYYERSEQSIGIHGDFRTSVSAGGLFGHLLAFQVAAWLEQLPPVPVQLVEAGAHDGQLAADILNWLRRHRPRLRERTEYLIIEPSIRRQSWQNQTLHDFRGCVRWYESFQALPASGIHGIMFSNELLDAMPVHRLGWDANRHRWFEWGVTWSNHRFQWCRLDRPLPTWMDHELNLAGLELADDLQQVIPDGFTVEMSRSAREWWQQAAATLKLGKLITIDYGFLADDFLSPHRVNGTLRAYRRHQHSRDPLADPGFQDLTAHVNFTQLIRAGEMSGLQTEGLTSQAAFLTSIAKRLWQQSGEPIRWNPPQVRQFQTLIHPDHFGRAFQVLIQSRPDEDGPDSSS